MLTHKCKTYKSCAYFDASEGHPEYGLLVAHISRRPTVAVVAEIEDIGITAVVRSYDISIHYIDRSPSV